MSDVRESLLAVNAAMLSGLLKALEKAEAMQGGGVFTPSKELINGEKVLAKVRPVPQQEIGVRQLSHQH